MITKKKEALIKEMTSIMLEKMTGYQADFTAYDIPRIVESEDDVIFWLVRDAGTHMITKELIEEARTDALAEEIINCYIASNEYFYECNLKEGCLHQLPEWELESRIDEIGRDVREKNVKEILMCRDDISEAEAESRIEDVQEQIDFAIRDGDYMLVEEIMLAELGLEMDYIGEFL